LDISLTIHGCESQFRLEDLLIPPAIEGGLGKDCFAFFGVRRAWQTARHPLREPAFQSYAC